MAVYRTEISGDRYAIKCNFAEASSPLLIESVDGWRATQYQAADFCHRPELAMATMLEDYVSDGGDDPADPDIAAAIRGAVADMA